MANRLKMDKSLAINNLHRAGYSQRRIAETLGVSHGAVRRHLASENSNGTKAPTAPNQSTPTGLHDSNSTEAPTATEPPRPVDIPAAGNSHCEPFRGIITDKLQAGLSSRRIHQDLIAEHGLSISYWSVNRFVKALRVSSELPFRRVEALPGEELQVGFGAGGKIPNPDRTHRRTHVFRAVLSHSRKRYCGAVVPESTTPVSRRTRYEEQSVIGVLASQSTC